MKDQLLWEQECLNRSQQRYFDAQDKTREQGTNLTDSGQFILKERLEELAELIREDCTRGKTGLNANYNKLVRAVAGEDEDFLKVGYMGLKLLLSKVSEGKKVKVSKFVARLGSMFEAELKCQMFQAEEPDYFHTVMKSFSDQSVTSSVHMQKALMKKFADFGLHWTEWTVQMKVHVGVRVLRNMLKCMGDLVFTNKTMLNGKTDYYLDTTVHFDEWVAEFEKERGLLLPMRLPLKCVPVPWADNELGGYYTPRMVIPFIKTSGKNAKEFVRKHEPKQHKLAVNKMQRTAWQINEEVLRVQEEVFKLDLKIGIPSREAFSTTPFPEHIADLDKADYTDSQKEEVTTWKMLRKRQYEQERKRKGQVLGFRQGHLLAKELRDWKEVYFVYNCDFRGRIYCATTGLSPQGSDAAKGLLRFAKEVVLGKSGLRWLAIHGANTFGEDKLSYDDRVRWIRDNRKLIEAIVKDPINNTQWGDADKPYQFLAFCYDWAKCDFGENPKATSQIPVGLDGSCNGLQHFSAMLRDEIGAKATNLQPCDKPEDIYGEVATVAMKKLKESDEPFAKIWRKVGITRKGTKRPVMTLPYGATQQSARQYLYEYTVENWHKFNLDEKYQWDMAKFITPIVWEAIGEVVVAARKAMDWLKSHVTNDYCSWTTIIGFPVFQHYRIDNVIQIRTIIEGGVRLYVPDLNKGVPYKSGQVRGIAPNFVHSIDSTHMVLTINAVDLHSYAMIHDDFGTHAGNTELLAKAIRRAFKYMYTKSDPLKHWADQIGVSMKGLPWGGYNIGDITDADYFFG